MADVVVFGAGDIASLADYYFSRDSAHKVVAFTVDGPYRHASTFLDRPLVDFEDVPARYPPDRFAMFIALSYAKMNTVRAGKYDAARALGYQLVSYVSSRCTLLTELPIGDNCLILEDNTIQPFSTIGNNVTLWSGNHVGHHSTIGDHCFVTSHVVVSGHVDIGPYCFLGVNATIRNGVRLAPRTLVGAGAAIMGDTEPDGVYLGARAHKASRPSHDIDL
ncbi:MAG: transferase [Acidobacteria bacterium]|nr:MAG: transferase [Acidobacteriota bacterium]PYR78388.1 MAG: transferase [Acidobacteriota bacterium]